MSSHFTLDANQTDELTKCKPIVIESNNKVRIVLNPFDSSDDVSYSCSLCHTSSKSLKGISGHFQQNRCYYYLKHQFLIDNAKKLEIESPALTFPASIHDVKVPNWPPQPYSF